jgi:maltose O-acetyltransferase
MIRTLAYYAYRAASYLPISYKHGGKIAGYLRYQSARRFVSFCGTNVNFELGAVFTPLLKIGNNSGVGVNAEIHGTVTIGNNVMMGPNVIVMTINHRMEDTTRPMITQGYTPEQPVVIEDDVWIGMRTIILPGVRIGTGSVIGAGAVVTKSIPPYSIAVGNPARVVKSRKPPSRK